jgi:uncharacterized protein YcbK (DUF882 family)
MLKAGLLAATAALFPGALLTGAEGSSLPRFSDDALSLPERNLVLYNVLTRETLEVAYWKDGRYIPEALSDINHIMRDSRTGREKDMKTELLDLLFLIRERLNSPEAFHIVSGYRTPGSNAYLRKRRRGVARNSLHMYGKAVDLRLPGCRLKDLRHTAMSFKTGGVGYYPRSKFVHIDVGDVRYWWG